MSTGKDNLLNAWRTPYGASIFQVRGCSALDQGGVGNSSGISQLEALHHPRGEEATWAPPQLGEMGLMDAFALHQAAVMLPGGGKDVRGGV